MFKSDRFIVAGSLALSCAALIFALRASVTPMAMAGLPLANDLGPADALLLTTEALIADKPEPAGAMPSGGGMGGMGGMPGMM